MENNDWISSQNSLPTEGEQVLILDYVLDDVLIDWAVFKNWQFYLLIGANIGIPAFWRRDIKLPEIVENTIKEN